jgi:hypothetical protein
MQLYKCRLVRSDIGAVSVTDNCLNARVMLKFSLRMLAGFNIRTIEI